MFHLAARLAAISILLTAVLGDISLKLYETDSSKYVTCTSTDVLITCRFTVRPGGSTTAEGDDDEELVPGQKYTDRSCFFNLDVMPDGEYVVVCKTSARGKLDRFALGDIKPKIEQTTLRVKVEGSTSSPKAPSTSTTRAPSTSTTRAPSTTRSPRERPATAGGGGGGGGGGACSYVCNAVRSEPSQSCPSIRVAIPVTKLLSRITRLT